MMARIYRHSVTEGPLRFTLKMILGGNYRILTISLSTLTDALLALTWSSNKVHAMTSVFIICLCCLVFYVFQTKYLSNQRNQLWAAIVTLLLLLYRKNLFDPLHLVKSFLPNTLCFGQMPAITVELRSGMKWIIEFLSMQNPTFYVDQKKR